MKKITLFAITLLFLTLSSVVFANNGSKDESGKANVEVKVQAAERHLNQKIEISNRAFEITGELTSVSGNSIVVAGQAITIDPSRVSEFEQKGILNVGQTVNVEGIIENGTKFAREIKVLGTGQGRFKVEVKNILPKITPGATSSATPSATPSPTSTSSANVKVEIKAKGPVEAVIAFLQQILSFLQAH